MGCSGQGAGVTVFAAGGSDLKEVWGAVCEAWCRGAGGILASAPGVDVVRPVVGGTISLSQQVGAMVVKL